MLCPILSVEQDTEYRNSKSISTKRKDGLFPIHEESPLSERILSYKEPIILAGSINLFTRLLIPW